MAKRKWASAAFNKVNEGSLGKLGWPNSGAVVAKVTAENRGQIVRKLLLLANGSHDPKTAAKAKAAIASIKGKLGDSSKPPEKK